jgi:hypothetical protein
VASGTVKPDGVVAAGAAGGCADRRGSSAKIGADGRAAPTVGIGDAAPGLWFGFKDGVSGGVPGMALCSGSATNSGAEPSVAPGSGAELLGNAEKNAFAN